MPPAGRVGDKAHCPADSHGCKACAHGVTGPAMAGSANVVINGRAALRVQDPGVHAACCGPNTWSAVAGASTVVINGLKAHRLGDATHHCGGSGMLIEGSPDVIIGDDVWSAPASMPVVPDEKLAWIEVICHYEDGTPAAYERFWLKLPDGSEQEGVLDHKGFARVVGVPPGQCEFSLIELDKGRWDKA